MIPTGGTRLQDGRLNFKPFAWPIPEMSGEGEDAAV